METHYERSDMKDLFVLINRYCYNYEGLHDSEVRSQYLNNIKDFLKENPEIVNRKYLSDNGKVYGSMLELFPRSLDKDLLHVCYEAGFEKTKPLMQTWLQHGGDNVDVLKEFESQIQKDNKSMNYLEVLSCSKFKNPDIAAYTLDALSDNKEDMKKAYAIYIKNTSEITEIDLKYFANKGVDISMVDGEPTMNVYMRNPNANIASYEALTSNGIEHNLELENGETILFTYLKENKNLSPEFVGRIKEDIDVNQLNEKGNDALMEAMTRSDFDVAFGKEIGEEERELVLTGVMTNLMRVPNPYDQTKKNQDGKSAAHLLAENRDIEDISIMMQNLQILADSNYLFRNPYDKKYKTPFHLLMENLQERIENPELKTSNVYLTQIVEYKDSVDSKYRADKMMEYAMQLTSPDELESEIFGKNRVNKVADYIIQFSDQETDLVTVSYLHDRGASSDAMLKSYVTAVSEGIEDKDEKVAKFLINSKDFKPSKDLDNFCMEKGYYITEYVSEAREMSIHNMLSLTADITAQKEEERFVRIEKE